MSRLPNRKVTFRSMIEAQLRRDRLMTPPVFRSLSAKKAFLVRPNSRVSTRRFCFPRSNADFARRIQKFHNAKFDEWNVSARSLDLDRPPVVKPGTPKQPRSQLDAMPTWTGRTNLL